jgi:hypothetical protein
VDKKNQQSKSQFGTMTAKSDANNDYSSNTQGMASSTANADSMQEYGTMTAKLDANNDYSKSGSQRQGDNANQQQQAGGKKPQTSDKNIGR